MDTTSLSKKKLFGALDMIASHMRHLWANPRFEAASCKKKNTEFGQ